MTPTTAWGWLAPLGALAACVPDLPKVARPNELPAAIRQAAIPLEEALAQKLVKVTLNRGDETVTEMLLHLQPLQESQPWIRIDAGWQIASHGGAENAFIIHEARLVRMPEKKSVAVSLPHVLLHYSSVESIAVNSPLVRTEDAKIRRLFDAVAKFPAPPNRKHLQFAVWSLLDDIAYRTVRSYVGAEPVAAKDRTRIIDAAELLQVVELLTRAGFDGEESALWRDANEELDSLVEKYENLSDVDPTTGIEPFRSIGAYYPLEAAADVVLGSFEKHQGAGGTPFRRHAIEILKRRGGRKEVEFLQEMAGFESDPEVLRALNEAIGRTASPPK